MLKKYGLRPTLKGFCLTEVEVKQTNYGGMRKYSQDIQTLTYKRLKYAEKVAHSFYKNVYEKYFDNVTLEYVGVIGPEEYKGEQV